MAPLLGTHFCCESALCTDGTVQTETFCRPLWLQLPSFGFSDSVVLPSLGNRPFFARSHSLFCSSFSTPYFLLLLFCCLVFHPPPCSFGLLYWLCFSSVPFFWLCFFAPFVLLFLSRPIFFDTSVRIFLPFSTCLDRSLLLPFPNFLFTSFLLFLFSSALSLAFSHLSGLAIVLSVTQLTSFTNYFAQYYVSVGRPSLTCLCIAYGRVVHERKDAASKFTLTKGLQLSLRKSRQLACSNPS